MMFSTAVKCLSLGLLLGSCIQRDVQSNDPKGNAEQLYGFVGDVRSWDVLLVIDDSVSMADKQTVLAESLSPTLFSLTGGRAYTRVGIISTSLEAGGTEPCVSQSRGARLIPPPNSKTPFWEGITGSGEPHLLDVSDWIHSVGDSGCGFEAPLEALYRFLIDPAPPASISVNVDADGIQATVAEGIDEELLSERKQFLRPRSSLMIIVLTDEDDCSVLDTGQGYRIAQDAPLAKGTSSCAVDPTDPCCRSCEDAETPDGCASSLEDAACQSPTEADRIGLRCFDQKRRFGVDLLHPLSRYIDGLSKLEIRDRNGNTVANPLFEQGREPSQVKLLTLTGVPWQYVAKSSRAEDELHVLTPADDRGEMWERLIGSSEEGPDVRLTQSIDPRDGLPGPDAVPFADPLISHEFENPLRDKLQHSCLFPLPTPTRCDDPGICECIWVDGQEQYPGNPVCEDTDGSPSEEQHYGRAYPAPRLWSVAHALSERAVVGSVCPKSHVGVGADAGEAEHHVGDQGYLAALAALWSAEGGASCERPLALNERGLPKDCTVVEIVSKQLACGAPGRADANAQIAEAVWQSMLEQGSLTDGFGRQLDVAQINRDDLAVCELSSLDGTSTDSSTPLYQCIHDVRPTINSEHGWCWLSEGEANEELLSDCASSERNRVRILPTGTLRPAPWGRPYARLVCW